MFRLCKMTLVACRPCAQVKTYQIFIYRLVNFLICHLKRELFHQNGRTQMLHHYYKNYRPVTLTSVLWKLLETFIRSHMVNVLVKKTN